MGFANGQNIDTSQCKNENSWRQWQSSLIEFLPLLSFGLHTGWATSPYSDDLPTPPHLAPWIDTVAYLAAAFSCAPYSFLNAKFGPKNTAVCVSLPQLSSWILLLLFPNDIALLLLSRILSGIGAGGGLIIIPIYLNEICKKSRRGLVVTFGILFCGLGYLMVHIIGQFLSYDIALYVVLSIPVVHVILSWFVIESPCFLVKRGRFEEAAQSVARLTGLEVDDERVTCEINRLKAESSEVKVEGNYVIGLIKNQVYRNGMKIGLVLQTVRTLGGSQVIVEQAWKVYVRSSVPLHNHIQTMALPAILVVAGLISALLVEKCGRKILLTVSACLTTFSLGILGVFMQTDLTVTSLNWLPLTALVLATIGYGLGFFAVPYTVIVEVVNFEVRSTILAITYIYTWLLVFVQAYTFAAIEKYIGLDAIIYIYAVVNIYGAVYSLFAIPETTNKGIGYIEKQLKRIPLLKF